MFITNGSRKLKHKIVWFLADINGFTERKLFIFEDIFKQFTVLEEKSIDSDKIFSQKNSGKKALDIIERERSRLLYLLKISVLKKVSLTVGLTAKIGKFTIIKAK